MNSNQPPSDGSAVVVEHRDLSLLEFPGYLVGSDGSLLTCWERFYQKGAGRVGVKYVQGDSWKPLRLQKRESGYIEAQLYRDGTSKHVLVHRLVLEAFVGEPPPGMEAFHENNNRSDNRLCNLRWATKQENQRHRKKFKTDSSGERHGLAVLSNAEAQHARERYAVLKSKIAVAREMGITRFVVEGIIREETYRERN